MPRKKYHVITHDNNLVHSIILNETRSLLATPTATLQPSLKLTRLKARHFCIALVVCDSSIGCHFLIQAVLRLEIKERLLCLFVQFIAWNLYTEW